MVEYTIYNCIQGINMPKKRTATAAVPAAAVRWLRLHLSYGARRHHAGGNYAYKIPKITCKMLFADYITKPLHNSDQISGSVLKAFGSVQQ